MSSLLIFTLGVLSFGSVTEAGDAPKHPGPGGHPADVDAALNHPDDYAWTLFMYLNRQALPGAAGFPDPGKSITQYDDDKPVVWETWALSSGGRFLLQPPDQPVAGNASEVFLNYGAKPVEWNHLPRTPASMPRKVFEMNILDRAANIRAAMHPLPPLPLPNRLSTGVRNANGATDSPCCQATAPDFEEVRMNQDEYEFVRCNDLYSIEGLEKEFYKEINTNTGAFRGPALSLPVASQEIKASWIKITEAQKPLFHWRCVPNGDGTKTLYGLAGLHIITKDLPNWFWCDFEQEDVSAVDQTALANSMHLVAQDVPTPPGILAQLGDSKWSHYHLRGTQVAFTDSSGNNVQLADTVTEHHTPDSSSCMTCHARATFKPVLNLDASLPETSLPIDLSDTLLPSPLQGIESIGAVGAPVPTWFLDSQGNPEYIQTDFVWSFPLRAMSKHHQ